MGGGPAATAALAADAAPGAVRRAAALALSAAAAATAAARLGTISTPPPPPTPALPLDLELSPSSFPYSTEARLRLPRSTTPPEKKPSSADVVARSDGAHCDRAGGSLAPEASTQIMSASDMCRRRCEGGGDGCDGDDG